MLEDFTLFFQNLDDDFFIELYETDYERIEQICWFLTIDLELQRQVLWNGDKRVADWEIVRIFTE